MKRAWIDQLPQYQGETVLIQGWVHRVRKLGSLAFLLVKDKTAVAQVVVEGQTELLDGVDTEAAVEIVGRVEPQARQPLGVEVHAASVCVLGRVQAELPFELNKQELGVGLEQVLDHRVLSLRHPKVQAIFKVQAEVVQGFRDYLRSERFTEIRTPKIVATGTEGGSELFPIQYFERRAYLAQSPQFYKQMMVGAGLQRVFEVAPVYRAEPHNTSRHLSEFISMDLEMGFITALEDLLVLEEGLLEYIFGRVREQCPAELALYQAELPSIGSIPRLKLKEIANILEREYHKEMPGLDIDPEGERLICQYIKKETGSDFVFATHYPTAKRPMYTMPDANEPEVTLSFDLLYKGLEMNSGGQRIHDYHQLVANIRMKGLNPEDFGSYLEIFQYGMPPHGGFAIGAERLTAKILNLNNIREATLFPRDKERLVP
ncbi:MAG: aspartate--tRNA(Asn) ligase [Bacillota bacterium]